MVGWLRLTIKCAVPPFPSSLGFETNLLAKRPVFLPAQQKAREKQKQMLAGRAVRLREQTLEFRLGKITAAAFYITLAGAFGAKRHTMIPKVLNLFCKERAGDC